MNRHLFLESFDRPATGRLEDKTDSQLFENLKSEAFEAGYTSGWDDAIASDRTSRMQLEAEFERNIQGIAFTFAEAVAQVRAELRTFLSVIVDQFLPEIAPDALRAHIRAELLAIGDELTDLPVEIVVSPDCNSAVAEMLEADFAMDIKLVEEPSLAAGQVYMRLGTREIEINLEPLIRAVSNQLDALKERPENEGDGDA